MRTITHHALICVALVGVALLAACGEKEDDGRLKVGYVVNFMSHEWYQNICRAAEARAVQLDVDIVIADANLDIAAQVSKAENLIAQGVDVLVLTPVDAKALGPVVAEANRRGIHVLTESNPVEGSLSYVGIDNKAAGKKAGLWYGAYAREHGIDSKVLIIGLPNFEDCRLRVDGFKEGLADSGVDYDIVQEVDGQGLKERALKVAQDALTANPDVNVIFGINDDSTTGGMAAYRAAGLDEDTLVAIGFGLEGTVGRAALLAGASYRAALGMFPEFVGTSLVDAAVKVASGQTLPVHYETPTLMITLDNFEQFYRPEGDDYALRLDAVRALMPEAAR
jgi:ABC-type sugar transport system substrate-binding protein